MSTNPSQSGNVCPGCGRTNYGRQAQCLVCNVPLAGAPQETLRIARPKFCTACGTLLQAQGKFCTNCGQQIPTGAE